VPNSIIHIYGPYVYIYIYIYAYQLRRGEREREREREGDEKREASFVEGRERRREKIQSHVYKRWDAITG
jgi:hypothetical protein